ncbi:MAG: D-amino acid aminotransferase [Gammaproteobacteria bacterium]
MPKVFLNGSFVPQEDACVSVMDRGFLFGDGVYEVIPVYGGRPFRLTQHLKRLHNSLYAIRLDNPFNHEEWTKILQTLVDQRPGEDQSLYLQVTRGVDTQRDHRFPQGVDPTVFAMSTLSNKPANQTTENGVNAITLKDIRWEHCNIKAITLLPNVLLRQQALEAGAAEAILLRDGWATEGAASNLFIVRDGLLITPPKGPRLLPGVTRDLVLELAVANGIPFREADITEQQMRDAVEIWLTSSNKEIMPVINLDEIPVGGGVPGQLFHHMIALYRDYKSAVRNGTAS